MICAESSFYTNFARLLHAILSSLSLFAILFRYNERKEIKCGYLILELWCVKIFNQGIGEEMSGYDSLFCGTS